MNTPIFTISKAEFSALVIFLVTDVWMPHVVKGQTGKLYR